MVVDTFMSEGRGMQISTDRGPYKPPTASLFFSQVLRSKHGT